MFTKDNLALSHGKAKPIQGAGEEKSTVAWREEYDEISDKSVDIARTAWRNWVEMNTFVHPGLMDCVAAHKCVVEAQNLSVKTLIEYFTKHIGEQKLATRLKQKPHQPPPPFTENRAACAEGAAMNLWDYSSASQALSQVINTQAYSGGTQPQTSSRKYNTAQNRGGSTGKTKV